MNICRALAQKWHPDHYDGDDKKKAEKMFIDIAAAKEVLTDEGMCLLFCFYCYDTEKYYYFIVINYLIFIRN